MPPCGSFEPMPIVPRNPVTGLPFASIAVTVTGTAAPAVLVAGVDTMNVTAPARLAALLFVFIRTDTVPAAARWWRCPASRRR